MVNQRNNKLKYLTSLYDYMTIYSAFFINMAFDSNKNSEYTERCGGENAVTKL